MKKEIALAILIGGLVGALLVGGIITANKALVDKPSSLVSAEPTGSTGPSESGRPQSRTTIPLNLVSPLDLSLVTSNLISVEGKTAPNAYLVIQTETDTYFVRSDLDGTFVKEVSLTQGSNDLTITAVANSGETTQKTVTVVYSTTTI